MFFANFKEIQQSLAVKKEESIQKQQEKEKSDLDIILKIEKKFNDEYEILLEKFRLVHYTHPPL